MPDTTSGRIAVPHLRGDDAAHTIDNVDKAQAEFIRDNCVVFAEGTFAARPAAGVPGRAYRVNAGSANLGILYWDTGSEWVQLYKGTGGRLQQTTGLATSTGNLICSLSYQDIPSVAATFTPEVACHALVQGAFHMEINAPTSEQMDEHGYGALFVDGVEQAGLAEIVWIHAPTVTTQPIQIQASCFQVWRVPLTAAEHTLKLRGKKAERNPDCEVAMLGVTGNCRMSYQLVAE